VCTLGPLASGADATIDIVAHAQHRGFLVNRAKVSGDQTDPDVSNNSVRLITRVRRKHPA
jgi:hypothetical protein